MIRILRNVLLVVVVTLITHGSYGQVTLGASPYVQNFNTIGSGLPVGWTVRTGSTASVLGTAASLATATTAWSNTAGNFRNVAAAGTLLFNSSTTDQNNASNRALAVRQTGAVGDPGGAFVLQIANTSGLSNFSLSFKLQSLDGSAAGRTTVWKVDYGFGALPTSFSTVTTNPASLSTTLAASGTSWGSTDVTVSLGTALDGRAENVWIRIVTLSASTGSGSRPTTGIDDFTLTYSASDVLPPAFALTYPQISAFLTDGFSVKSRISEEGKTYFAVLADGSAAPTSVQVKAGQDATGTPLASNFFGFVTNSTASAEAVAAIAGLSSATDYDVYVVAEDNFANLQVAPVKLDARTNTIGDVTAPAYTTLYPDVSSITPKTFTVKTSLDEIGRTYFALLPMNAPAPTSAQVMAGQDGNNTPLPTNLFGTVSAPTSDTEFTSAVSGLTPGTAYDVYFVTEDNVPNLQPSPTKVTVTTTKLFEENFNDCNGTSSFSSFSVSGDQVWACNDFGYNTTKSLRMNGFSGSAVANEDWLISPGLNLTAGANLSFYSQFSFAGDGLQLKISIDYAGNGDPSSATWTNLNGNFPTVAVGSTSTSLSDWTLSNVDLSAYASQKIYLAFVYTSSSSAASRWTLDEINVTNAVPNYMAVVPAGLVFNTIGEVKTYTLKGVNLLNDVSVSAPASFEISKDNTTFSSSLLYTAVEANAGPAVYVRFNLTGTGTNTYSGLITNVSAGVASKNVSVTGADKSRTFNITTYNLEFFGADVVGTGGEFGPVNDPLQISNVTTVMQTIGSDIFAVEEVGNDEAFNTLASNLTGYDKILADKWSYYFDANSSVNFPPQKIGFLYKTANVQLVSSRVMFSKFYDDIRAAEAVSLSSAQALLPGYPTSGGNTPSNFWSSGRLPFMGTFDVTINGIRKRIRVIDIHAKSGSAQEDYDRRKYDIKLLHDSLTAYYPNDNIILIGDYNDDVDASINTGSPSTYDVFVNDANNFTTLTYALSQSGAVSFPSSSSFLDHITISDELNSNYVNGSILVEDPRTYIPSYTTTTSDHLPVSARFEITKSNQTITFDVLAAKNFGSDIFTLTATSTSTLPITYTSSDPSIVSISGSTATIKKAGAVNITASQAGDNAYLPATDVVQPLTINKASHSIAFTTLPAKTLGDAPFSLSATATSSLAVNFSTTSDKVTLSGTQVTLVKAGSVTITASQSGNDNYGAATPVNQTFCINPAKPTITVTNMNTEAPTLTSSASTGNQWYLNGTAIAGATNATYSATLAGVYKVQVKADNCVSAFSNDTPLVVTGDLKNVNEVITVFPNPVEDYLMISGLSEELKECTVTDMMGRALTLQCEKQNGTHRADVRSYGAGLYLMRIQLANASHQIKFIKK